MNLTAHSNIAVLPVIICKFRKRGKFNYFAKHIARGHRFKSNRITPPCDEINLTRSDETFFFFRYASKIKISVLYDIYIYNKIKLN